MNKIKLDPKTRAEFVKAGRKGGQKFRDTHDSEYFSKLGLLSWKKRLKREGKDAIRKRLSDARKAGIKRQEEKKRQQERRKKLSKVGGEINDFLREVRLK